MRVVKNGPLAETVRGVQIEPAIDNDDDEFLRIALLLKLPKRDVDKDLQLLLEGIEDAVASVDHRYASVRFLDAA